MRVRQTAFAFGTIASFLLLSFDAQADGAYQLKHNANVDAPISIGAMAIAVGLELVKPELAPSCVVCERNADGSDSLNGVDRGVRAALVWNNKTTANIASYVTGFGAPAASAFTLIGAGAADADVTRFYPTDMLIVFESVALTAMTTQIAKFIVRRERPFLHAMSSEEKAARKPSSDDNVSFFSGHTSVSFALAASAGTVAEMRGYRLAPAIWGAGAALATVTGYLRIAADKHYFSDVLVGAVVGSAIGIGVPLLFHGRERFEAGTTANGAIAAPLQIMSYGGTF